MRDLDECRKEIYKRSKEKIKKRARLRNYALSFCVLLLLCGVTLIFAGRIGFGREYDRETEGNNQIEDISDEEKEENVLLPENSEKTENPDMQEGEGKEEFSFYIRQGDFSYDSEKNLLQSGTKSRKCTLSKSSLDEIYCFLKEADKALDFQSYDPPDGEDPEGEVLVLKICDKNKSITLSAENITNEFLQSLVKDDALYFETFFEIKEIILNENGKGE